MIDFTLDDMLGQKPLPEKLTPEEMANLVKTLNPPTLNPNKQRQEPLTEPRDKPTDPNPET